MSTKEFDNKESITQFMQRRGHLKESGICANLIYKDKTFFCPGHPAQHNGKDFRVLDPYCDRDYICKTLFLFKSWTEEKQNRYLEFLKGKNLDNVEYSMKTYEGTLLKEFEEMENH